MSHVATLIVHPATLALEATYVARVAQVLPMPGAPVWLEQRVAADIPFVPPAGSDNARWAEAARHVLGDLPMDVVVQPFAHRRKRLLIADMDSTIIEQECIDELADACGLRAEVAAITERSVRGDVSFEGSLIERVALLRGLDAGRAAHIVAERTSLMQGAQSLVRTMRAYGAVTALASGGFSLFTAHVAHQLGFDRHYANTLVIESGRLSGTVEMPIFGRAAKARAALRALREEFQLATEETIAVGDGANDLAMLEEAGLGVAFRAKPAVAAVARARIDHGDLTALLYIQGYGRAEFAA